MVNRALTSGALSGPKKSAKGKYTASSVLAGRQTATDRRVADAKKREDAKRARQREEARRNQKSSSSKQDTNSTDRVQQDRDQQALEQRNNEVQRAFEERKREIEERKKLDKPGGWRNVVDVMKIAINPFSKDKIVAGEGLGNTALEAIANNPYSAAAIVTGVAGLMRGAVSGIAAVTSKSAVAQAGKIGTTGLVIQSTKSAGVVTTMATNTATKKATASMLTKLVGAVKDPQFVVGALMASIGSYPFSGFIKEEALQTMGFGITSAIGLGDDEAEDKAVAFEEQLLDPGLWDAIKSKIPFVNVLSALDDFYAAARIKLDIDKKVIADLRYKRDFGETDAQMYARIAEERVTLKEQERVADAEYYKGIEERKAATKAANRADDAAYYAGLSAAKVTAAKKKRAEDEAYWDKILNDKPAEQAGKARLDDDYWTEYYKTLAKVKANSAPSNLKFGLL